jgi:hypothetical protein
MSTWDPEGRDEGVVQGGVGVMRQLASTLLGRSQLANWSGFSFHGARNMFRVLGYDRTLTPRMYRWRYERGGIVGRLVDAYPIATWRGGGELVEDEDPDTLTTFEAEWDALNKRLKLWNALEKADILARLGRFSVLLLGGPGADLSQPLVSMPASQFAYIQPFSERDATVTALETDTANARFGQPNMYSVTRLTAPLQGIAASMARQIHWTRVVHIADGLLDDNVFGQPSLQRIWNLLDDLDKVVGGGAEAFWKRADAGMHLKLDPTVGEMKPDDKAKFDTQLEDYTNGLQRILRTRGVDIETLSSQVANMNDPMKAVVALLSAATGIPQRILLGSERGELASSQDTDEWNERVMDRRQNFANNICVRPLIDRLIALGTITAPQQYEARWPSKRTLTDAELVSLAKEAALANQAQGEIIISVDEIRDRFLDLPPLSEVLTPEEMAARIEARNNPNPPAFPTEQKRAAKWAVLSAQQKVAYRSRLAAKRKETHYKGIHASADRFSRRSSEARVASVR